MSQSERFNVIMTFGKYQFLFLILISCSQLAETSNDKASAKALNFTQLYKTFQEPECTVATCAAIEITTINSSESYRINQFVDNKINEIILSFTKNENANSLDQVTQYFFDDYKEFKQAFPESSTPWKIEIKTSVEWMSLNKGWLSLRFETYSYTGGAHPNTFTEYINISGDGELLSTSDWLADTAVLLEVAEEAFRQNENIPASQNLGDAGYIFENEDFSLPENIGFSNGNMVLHYNDYEISSYANGATIIEIPLSKLRNTVNL
jgi:hypothetical protein